MNWITICRPLLTSRTAHPSERHGGAGRSRGAASFSRTRQSAHGRSTGRSRVLAGVQFRVTRAGAALGQKVAEQVIHGRRPMGPQHMTATSDRPVQRRFEPRELTGQFFKPLLMTSAASSAAPATGLHVAGGEGRNARGQEPRAAKRIRDQLQGVLLANQA
jgi:hypothetical protein